MREIKKPVGGVEVMKHREVLYKQTELLGCWVYHGKTTE